MASMLVKLIMPPFLTGDPSKSNCPVLIPAFLLVISWQCITKCTVSTTNQQSLGAV